MNSIKHNGTTAPVEILLVEDSPDDVIITREAFSESKILNNIHVASDGVEALDFLHKRGKFSGMPRPHIILLDLNLPRKDGRVVLEEIKTDSSLKDIPVVILTTSKTEEDILKSYRLHANCYITKPVDLNKFIDIVKSIEQFWFSIVTLPGDR